MLPETLDWENLLGGLPGSDFRVLCECVRVPTTPNLQRGLRVGWRKWESAAWPAPRVEDDGRSAFDSCPASPGGLMGITADDAHSSRPSLFATSSTIFVNN